MPTEIERFRALVHADEAMQAQLYEVLRPQEFVTLATRLAAQHGIALVEGDVWQAMAEGRSDWLKTWAP